MPTPVPLKILSRRHQRNRLIVVLLLAVGLGAATRVAGPPVPGRVHLGALAALIVLSAACVVILLGLRRIAFRRAWTVFTIEATALWLCFAAGCLILERRAWDEVLAVSGIAWAVTVVVGLVALSVIQERWPPLRLMTCPGCTYDLSGLTSNVCPECGDRFEAACAACGCALHRMTGGECPDCRSVFAPGTVLISPLGVASR